MCEFSFQQISLKRSSIISTDIIEKKHELSQIGSAYLVPHRTIYSMWKAFRKKSINFLKIVSEYLLSQVAGALVSLKGITLSL